MPARPLPLLLAALLAHGAARAFAAEMDVWQMLEAGEVQAARPLLHALADRGDAHAALALYAIYMNGIGTQPSPDNAMHWLRLAAEGGIAEARFELGNYLYRGTHVKGDRAQALDWWRRAAQQGYLPAQQNLAALGLDWSPPAPEATGAPAAEPAVERATVQDGAWLLEQDAGDFTIHVATGDNPESLREMLARELPQGPAAVAAAGGGSPGQYIAVYGVFPDTAQAREAEQALPETVRAYAPRVRSFAVVQRLVLATDTAGNGSAPQARSDTPVP